MYYLILIFYSLIELELGKVFHLELQAPHLVLVKYTAKKQPNVFFV